MFFRKPKKLSASVLCDLNRYLNHRFPPPKEEEDAAENDSISVQSESVCPPQMRAPIAAKRKESRPQTVYAAPAASLRDALGQIDESFSEMLFRKIDEKHMTDAQCYKKAQIDRKLFSKIRSQKDYRPSKATALSFALALELPLGETNDLLLKAGYALSHSSKADIIVEYCILHHIYDKILVNEALYEFDQPLL